MAFWSNWFTSDKVKPTNSKGESYTGASSLSISYRTPTSVDSARTIPEIERLIGTICSPISMLKLSAFDNHGRKLPDDEMFERLKVINVRPNNNPGSNASNFLYSLAQDYILSGISTAYPVRDENGIVKEIYHIPSDEIEVNQYTPDGLRYYASIVHSPIGDGRVLTPITYSADELLIISQDSSRGLKSKGFLHLAQSTLRQLSFLVALQEKIIEQQKLGKKLIAVKMMNDEDGNPVIGDEEWLQMQRRINNTSDSKHAVIQADGVNVIDISSHDLNPNLYKHREMLIGEICNLFGTSASRILSSQNKYNSRSEEVLEFAQEVLLPIVTDIQQQLTDLLLTEDEVASGIHLKFNIESTIQLSKTELANLAKTLSGTGTTTVDELRRVVSLEEFNNEFGNRIVSTTGQAFIDPTGESGMITPNLGEQTVEGGETDETKTD